MRSRAGTHYHKRGKSAAYLNIESNYYINATISISSDPSDAFQSRLKRASVRPGLPAGYYLADHRHQPFTNSTI